MRIVTFQPKNIIQHFYKYKILTKNKLLELCGFSHMTAWRILKNHGYFSSYNFNAMYYTLIDIPTFDEYGLWSFQKVRFSRYGSLTKTIIELIKQSKTGFTAEELKSLIHSPVQPSLSKLYRDSKLYRIKVDGVFVYFSSDAEKQKVQLSERQFHLTSLLEKSTLPKPESIIAVMVELIKKPQSEPDVLAKRLSGRGIHITTRDVKAILTYYKLEKKKIEMLRIRAKLIGELDGPLPEYCLLPKHYQLDVVTARMHCECGRKLRIQWRSVRYPVGILLGEPKLCHHIKQCPSCKKIYPFEQLHELVPPHGRWAFDIIAEVGIARYRKHKQDKEVQQELQHRYKLILPYNSISTLANRFLDNFTATHYSRSGAISHFINKEGGFLFYLDGTCEGGTDVFFVIIEGKSKLALASSRMATENMNDIALIIDKCMNLFGIPLGIVRDLSNNIALAIQKVAKDRSLDLLDFVCQYHFLEKVGERLCKDKHDKLTQYLRKLKIRSSLTSMRSSLVQRSKNAKIITAKELNDYLNDPREMLRCDLAQLQRHLVYTLLCWLNDSGADLKGEYFPFDLPSLAYYRRCVMAYDMLKMLLSSSSLKRQHVRTMQTVTNILSPVRNDEILLSLVMSLEKSEEIFNEFRCVLRFNETNNKSLLRQHQPDLTIEEALKIEKRLIEFRDQLKEIVQMSDDSEKIKDAKICETYLDKYWKSLFGHVITPKGSDKLILAYRTNHISEQHFGNTKGGWRRRVGTKKMVKHFQGSRPEELLVSNLDNQDYIDIVYGGSLDNLPVCFAKNWKDGINIRKTLAEKKSNHPLPVSKKILRDPDILSSLEKGIKELIENNSFVLPVVSKNSSTYLVEQFSYS